VLDLPSNLALSLEPSQRTAQAADGPHASVERMQRTGCERTHPMGRKQ
jgi:hypothetical protein